MDKKKLQKWLKMDNYQKSLWNGFKGFCEGERTTDIYNNRRMRRLYNSKTTIK